MWYAQGRGKTTLYLEPDDIQTDLEWMDITLADVRLWLCLLMSPT
jgi:hypothetical protein